MPSFLVKKIESHLGASLPLDRWEHTQRVRQFALRIAKDEKLDEESVEVVELASLMHDMAFQHESTLPDHAMASSKLARDTLLSFDVPPVRVGRVCHCIESHSFYSGVRPKTIEAKIVFDANSFEIIGPVGVLRVCLMMKDSEETSIVSVAHKVRAVGLRHYESLHTRCARGLARKYWLLGEQFLEKLEEQLLEK